MSDISSPFPSVLVLIVAAGRGARCGGSVPKQYAPLAGSCALRLAIESLLAHPGVRDIAVILHRDDLAHYEKATHGLELLAPVWGGETRQDSVRAGLKAYAADYDRVLIHDAARPFPTVAMMEAVLSALDHHAGALPALPVADSIKRGGPIVTEELARDGLWRAQTPQGFHTPALLAAYDKADPPATDPIATDDAALVRAAGFDVAIVPGDESAFKITLSADLVRAQALLQQRLSDVRVGQGFDVHAFGSGDHVWLCGVKIAHPFGLMGHSDADVGLHALVDALLGALALGDIGTHFPPTDPQWRGADSARFVDYARAQVAARGGMIAHVDITLICESPKIGPHRMAMIARVATLLHLPIDRVSVKATTTEKLGFTGRGEGIAAQAIATLRLP